jgi:hypothetical protein
VVDDCNTQRVICTHKWTGNPKSLWTTRYGTVGPLAYLSDDLFIRGTWLPLPTRPSLHSIHPHLAVRQTVLPSYKQVLPPDHSVTSSRLSSENPLARKSPLPRPCLMATNNLVYWLGRKCAQGYPPHLDNPDHEHTCGEQSYETVSGI